MKMRKMIALLCVFVLVLSTIGCNKKKEAEPTQEIQQTQDAAVTKEDKKPDAGNVVEEKDKPTEEPVEEEQGYYIESQAELDGLKNGENMMDLILNAEGDLECYTCIQNEAGSEAYCYTIKDGKSEKKPVEWANKAIKEVGRVPIQFEMGGDGEIFMFLQDWIDMGTKVDGRPVILQTGHIMKDSGNHTDYVDVAPEKWNDKENKITPNSLGNAVGLIRMAKDGIVVYENVGETALYAYSLKEQKELDVSALNKTIDLSKFLILSCIKDNCIYYYADGDPNICSFDLITQEAKKIPCDIPLSHTQIYVSDDGSIYLANIGGIYCYRSGETTWKNIMPGENKAIGSPNYTVSGLLVKEGEHKEFYVGLKSMVSTGKDMIACYQYSDEPLPEVTDQLTVYSLRENKTIRSAIIEYQKENPDITINYQVAMPVEGEANVSDVIRTLNTEMLAGKGADVLVLDGLPMNSYIDKGALLDLSDILSPMVSEGTLLKNIADNYCKDDKIYSMPLRYIIPYYVTSEDMKEKMGSLKDIAALNQSLGKPLLPARSYEQLFRMILYTYYDDFMKDSKKIDAALYSDFLKQMKEISENMKIGDWDLQFYLDGGMEYGQAYKWFVFSNDSLGQMMEGSFASTGYAADITGFNQPFASAKQQKGVVNTMNDAFMASGIVGVNSMTGNQALAKDFIKYLFSEKVQSSQTMDGFPVNADSLEAWCNIEPTEAEHSWLGASDKDGKEVHLEVKGATVEERHELKRLMTEVTLPTFDNEIIFDMIMEESLGYFTGEKTLEQAVNDTTSKLNLYLAEQ